MKLIIVIIIGFSACSPKWQKEFSKKSIPFVSSDSTLNKLTNESSVVLIQDLVRPYELGYIRYNIVYRQNKQWYTLNYLNEGNLKVTKEEISKSKGDSILNVFIVNRFWNINKQRLMAELRTAIVCFDYKVGKPIGLPQNVINSGIFLKLNS